LPICIWDRHCCDGQMLPSNWLLTYPALRTRLKRHMKGSYESITQPGEPLQLPFKPSRHPRPKIRSVSVYKERMAAFSAAKRTRLQDIFIRRLKPASACQDVFHTLIDLLVLAGRHTTPCHQGELHHEPKWSPTPRQGTYLCHI
jgi:hypothetical protein